MRTLAPTAATDPRPDPATPGGSSRFEPSAYRAASRKEALRLARDAKVLPEDVRWFYLRALRSAARRDEPSSLADGERPEELAGLLELARGSEQVIGFAGRSALSAISLALSEEGRRVTVFDSEAEPRDREDYLGFVNPDVRSRIDFCAEPAVGTAKALSGADLVFVDPSAGYQRGLAAARSGERIVRPGGLMVLRGYRSAEVDEVIAKLRLEGSVVDGAFVWRKPVGGRGRRSRADTTRDRLRLPVLGLVIGAAVAVVLPPSLTDSGPGLSGSAREGASPEPRGSDARASEPRGSDGRGSDSRASDGRESMEPARRSGSSVPQRPRSDRPSRVRRQLRMGAGAFSGTGDRKLGTLRVDRPMTMQWTTGDGSFVIVSGAWRFRPRRQSGTTLLTPGTYRRFAVHATASWKLKLSPAGQDEQRP